MVTIADYAGTKPAWCPGCGNFGILKALNQALVELNIEPQRVLFVSGIGQAGKLPHYTRGNVFNSLHGRPLPVAVGAKIANPSLVVIAVSGDGDAYGEGGNHFIHTARRNHDITYLVHDNQVYGLTKGQASPTSDLGFVTGSTPEGAVNPVNPVLLALAAGATFVGRSFSGDIDHLSDIIKKGIGHKGFAVIDILQPCVSFNHKNTYSWYQRRVYKIDKSTGYDPDDKDAAFKKAGEWGDRIPIGVLFQTQSTTYDEQLPGLSHGNLVESSINPGNMKPLFADFM
jgi:2-oxoglutarate/2-oxoacid ferredoxin oxidoreductase subunit beta